MASIGTVALQLGLVTKEFQNGLDKATGILKNSVDNFKNILVAAKLGQYLMTGANEYVDNQLRVIYAELSALSEGFTRDQINALKPLAEQFEYLGIEAETATQAMQEFILSGKATTLKQLGIYLSDTTKEMLRGMDAAQRYQWVLENMPERINGLSEALDDETKQMLATRKTFDDLRESMGKVFLTTIGNIINAFGGLQNAMKAALIAFNVYKIATIVGNLAIGISKSVAQGGIFMWPVIAAMSVGAIASIGALIGGSVLAGKALDNIPSPDSTLNSSDKNNNNNFVSTVVVRDRFGETQKVMSERNGGGSNNVQTSYGANN